MTKMKDRGVRTYIFISNKNEGEIGVGSRMLNQQIRLKKSGIGEIQLQSILGGIGCTFELTEFFSIQSSFLSYTQKCDTLRITGNRMERLPLETRTLYAELMDQLTALEAGRSLGRCRSLLQDFQPYGTTPQVRPSAGLYPQMDPRT